MKETKFKVILKEPKGGGYASISKVDGKVYLRVNPANWERNPGFGEGALRAVLRHECLHLETGLDDRDPRFKQAARERGIDIWRV